MSKISYEDNMRIQTFQEIVTNFRENGWKLSLVKGICTLIFIS